MITKFIPTSPGCYLFKDSEGKIIYIGKAKNLRKRVKSYFQKNHDSTKTEQLVAHILDVDFIATNTEAESLLLENNLIKKHKPKYNIDLKDAKRYTYILVTDEPFPRLMTVREKGKNGTYIGPFVSGYDRLKLLDLVKRQFKLRTCKKLPKRACLRYHIGLCCAPCIGAVNNEEYAARVHKAKQVLEGKNKQVVGQLKEEMTQYSTSLQFEKALERRDQIAALEYVDEQQHVEREKSYDEDVINFIIRKGKVYLMLFHVYKGTLLGKQEFVFDYVPAFLDQFISQYYAQESIPKEIIVPQPIDEDVLRFLSITKGTNVQATVPKIGDKKILLRLVKKNVLLGFFGDHEKVVALQDALQLQFSPEVIECFDISHLQGTATVGSMVYFRNGKPDKNNYRRFRIQSYLGNDDFAGIYEVVMRRYKRLKEEHATYPDLIVIDGGKGQLSAALKALEKLEVKIPIISLAKKCEEVYFPGRSAPYVIDKKHKGLLYLREIRDDAHRFAISYNRLLRKKKIRDK